MSTSAKGKCFVREQRFFGVNNIFVREHAALREQFYCFSLINDILRRGTIGEPIVFHALDIFEVLGYLAFHIVLFLTSGKKISNMHYYFTKLVLFYYF